MRRPATPARWLAERIYATACVAVIAACAVHALHLTVASIQAVQP
jgi:hypothetical protein